MRSRTGCLTCRTRKLKCDEQKPQCSQCRKGNRECRPSEGIVFRHQQNASMNNGSTATTSGLEEGSDIAHDENRRDGRGGSLKGFYSYKNTFDENNVWLEIPKQVVFVDNSDPYAEEVDAGTSETRPAATSTQEHHIWEGSADGPEPALSMQAENHGLEALSAVATHDRLSFYPVSGPEQNDIASAAAVAAAGNDALLASGDFDLSGAPSAVPVSSTNNNMRFLLNPSHRPTPPVDPRTNAASGPGTTMSISARPSAGEYDADISVETEHETAFLLRHFSEAPGLWMDLFDLRTYFASHVPVRAVRNPLLKNAACAYAAKQLGRVKGAKAPVGGVRSQPSVMETWSAADKVDWYWHGAKYYEKAIQLLMKELQPNMESHASLSAMDGLQEEDAEIENPRKRRRTRLNGQLSGRARSDDVLAATAILSLYEFHDATDPAWSRHLSGVKSLLDVTEAGIQPLEPRLGAGATLHPKREPALSRARKATFWNFARQDYLAAFINKTQTRLDTDDLTLWTDAGVQLDNRGFVRPSGADSSGYSGGGDTVEEDVICNALIYVSSKIVNFINAVDTVATVESAHHVGLGRPAAPKQPPLERWNRLEAELSAWFHGLPESFEPCARIEPNRSAQNLANDDASPFSEIWYSIPMCGSCMQHYHMARILLLLHKPGQSPVTGVADYPRSVASEIRHYCYEICGISMSRPSAAVRIHSLQPLFVSGQHLTETRERRAVVQLMRSIETDLGWATEYRVKQLFEYWGWADGLQSGITGS